MKIATWNLERPKTASGARVSRLREHMVSVAADVWILTETHEDLAPGVDYNCAASGTPDRPSHPGERWIAIWSRFPMGEPIPTCDPARTIAVRVMADDGPNLLVYGTVLPWLGSPWNGHASRGGVAFEKAIAEQEDDWTRLSQENPDCEFILAGDLNQDLSDRHFYGSRMNRARLRKALLDAGLQAMTAAPTDPVSAHSRTRASVDHLCVPLTSIRWRHGSSGSWPRTESPPRDLSDHFGAWIVPRES